MYCKVSKELFVEKFLKTRPDNFSLHGLETLYNWLEEVEDGCEPGCKLDVIAICCEYSELSIEEAINDYSIDIDDIENKSKDAIREEVLEYLQDRTIALQIDDNTILVQN